MTRARLSRQQRRALAAVARMCASSEGCAHDAEGDLSVCTGNMPATMSSLAGRGLITREWVDMGHDIYDGYYEYRITDAGTAAL